MEDQGKRLLLAVAIAFAIMLLWSLLFPPKREKPKAPESKDHTAEKQEAAPPAPESETAPAPAPTGAGAAGPAANSAAGANGAAGPAGANGAAPAGANSAAGANGAATPGGPGGATAEGSAQAPTTPAAPRAPEKTFELDFPELRATFSSYGAALKSWQLMGNQFHVPGQPSVPDDLVKLGPQGYYDLAIRFADGSTFNVPASAVWTGEKKSDREVDFTWSSDDLRIQKRFRIDPEDYLVELSISYQVLHGNAKQALVVSLFSQENPNLKHTKVKHTRVVRAWRAACDVDDEVSYWTPKSLSEHQQQKRGRVQWGGFSHAYFLAAAAPRVEEAQLGCRAYAVPTAPGGMGLDIQFPTVALGGSQGNQIQTSLVAYLGPKYLAKLESISKKVDFDTGFGKAVDLGWFGFIAGPLLWLLEQLHSLVGAWGVAIILLTILIKVATLYWTHKSMKSMRAMAKLRPQLDKIREKYKEDKQKQQVETMNLFKAHGVSPLAGCLPMLLQMPIWFALYRALSVAAQLYQAPFLWLNDLTAPDPYFILPVFMIVTMLLQSRLTPTTASGFQQKLLTYGMPAMFGVFSLFFPAGLTLYICTNTVLTLLHHLYMRRDDLKDRGPGGDDKPGPGAATSGARAAAALAARDDGEEGEDDVDDGGAARSSGGKGAGAGKPKGGSRAQQGSRGGQKRRGGGRKKRGGRPS